MKSVKALLRTFLLVFAIAAIAAPGHTADRVVAANYPPIMIEGEGERPGFAIEILREAARRAGRKVDITFLPFQRAMYTVQMEDATLMPALFKGKKGDEAFLWLVQIQTAKLSFSTTGLRIDDLETARGVGAIVVETGSTPHVFLSQLGFDNLIEVSTPEASARMLLSGRATAWLQSRSAMRNSWAALKQSKPLTLGDVVHQIPIFMVASPTLPDEMIIAYRAAVQAMLDDGTMAAIWGRYGLSAP